MKKLIILLLLLFAFVGTYAQGFLKPVPKDLFSKEPTADMKLRGTSLWLIRPAIEITAVQWNWDKVEKKLVPAAFQSAGLGVGYQHFRPVSATDLTPYNDIGANLLLLLGVDVSVAGTVSALNGLINLGVLYNFTMKTPGLLAGVQIRF